MSETNESLFEAFLSQHDERSWRTVLDQLLPAIHEVDRTATRIWFYFYPLPLARAIAEAEDPELLAFELVLLGKYRLSEQIDSSHHFLYGHRYWREVKEALTRYALSSRAPSSLDIATQIRNIATAVAGSLSVEASLTTGITAVAFMTMQQVGFAAFAAAPGEVELGQQRRKSPEKILKKRARDDRQGILASLRGLNLYTITFNEGDREARFKLIESQHLTTAAAADKRDYHSRESRCIPAEGPIPVQCRSASCGTCWVGVLGGAEKLSDVGQLERRRIKEFGYIETDDPKPIIRLACQAQGHGAVSIVIPPWNGVFGKQLAARRTKQSGAEAGSTR
jgi:ferredoxin